MTKIKSSNASVLMLLNIFATTENDTNVTAKNKNQKDVDMLEVNSTFIMFSGEYKTEKMFKKHHEAIKRTIIFSNFSLKGIMFFLIKSFFIISPAD